MVQSITEKSVPIFKEKFAKKNEDSQNIYFSFVKHLIIPVETSACFIWAQTEEQKGYMGATCRVVSSHVHLLSTAALLDKWKKTKIILR